MTAAPWKSEPRIPPPEEMQAIIRRAHAERAAAIKAALLALLAWRKAGPSRAAAVAGLKPAPCA